MTKRLAVHCGLLAVAAFVTAVQLPAASGPAKSAPEPCFGPLTSVPLPESLAWARDIRFLGDQEVLISAYGAGLVRLRLDRPGEAPKIEIPQGPPHTAAGSAGSIGASEQYLAIGGSHFAVGWQARKAGGSWIEDYFEFTQDIDVQGERIALLGLRRGDDRRAYDQDGAYLWLGSLAAPNLESLRPLAFSSDRGSARRMDACGPVGVGAVRFLEDSSIVAIPLAEPGVALFRPDGRLTRTWSNEEFGLDEGCDVTEEMLHRLSMDPQQQRKWINDRRVVEDILPLSGSAFAILVRHHGAGTTRWRMEFANAEGRLGTCELPLTVESPWVELRADYRGGRVVLLQGFRRHGWNVKVPQMPPRLLVGTFKLPNSSLKPDPKGGAARKP